MKNTNLENLETQETLAKTNPLQTCYIIYAGLYGILCGRTTHQFGIIVSDKILIVLFVGVVLFTIAVIIYNHKYEDRRANKQVCYLFTLLALCRFLVHFVPYLV